MSEQHNNPIDADGTNVTMSIPRLLMLIGTVGFVVAGAVAGYVSIISNQEHMNDKIGELTTAIVELRLAGQEDRYRGKDADRAASVFYTLNREKFPDLQVPIPTSVRDGNIEVFTK